MSSSSPSDTRQTPPNPEQLSGLVERVTFFNEESGFAVLKVKVKGQRELATVVGTTPSANPGEWVFAEGRWEQTRDYGPQFRAEKLQCTPPTTRQGIEKYLASGMVKGIGPVYAGKLVEKFGADIFNIIENYSIRLEEIEGIGPQRRRQIKEAWAEQKMIRDIMLFLHSNGVSTSRAVRIYKTYGEDAIEIVRANPYTLARDIHGIGFPTADRIAQEIGIPADSLLRARAGLLHALLEAGQEGHCALPRESLCEQTTKLLGVDRGLIDRALQQALTAGEVVQDRVDDHELIYPPHLLQAEKTVAWHARRLTDTPAAYPPIDIPKALTWWQDKTGKELAPSQKEALTKALKHRLVVLTGGPGVGKTTLVNAIIKILQAKKVRCLLCAPTGRAAKRLTETSGIEAKTIHRLLEVQPGNGRFARNESNPLETDLLVVDECSMVDIQLMSHLMRALPPQGHLLLVGDVDQLPSVGPGLVLQHLIESGRVPTLRLTEIFRQAARSQIVTNAHRINAGRMPVSAKDPESDFHFIERHDPEAIVETILTLAADRIPKKFGLDAINDIQVLCPMNRGSLGMRQLNSSLQARLNPPRPEVPAVEKFGWRFQAGDKVIQTVNNYDKEVFNGDIGRITRLDPEERQLAVRFEGREVVYDFGSADELTLAYAVTIHKSQGSEFPAVLMPIATQQYLLLQRNLIYTGITRGKALVMLIGQPKALNIALRQHHTARRYSGLLDRLKQAGGRRDETPDFPR